jgi:putative effector of murein hydrolase LrgA (UPF0299 family)
MKRILGTVVLFVLLILTMVALQKVDTPSASAISKHPGNYITKSH